MGIIPEGVYSKSKPKIEEEMKRIKSDNLKEEELNRVRRGGEEMSRRELCRIKRIEGRKEREQASEQK